MGGKVQLKGCICEPGSDIPLNWIDMQSEFGYTTLSEIASKRIKMKGDNIKSKPI